MKKVIHFLKYHNGVPIALGIIFLSSGAALAASPEVREQVISSEAVARSVDNSYILSLDLEAFNPGLQITAITEDDNFYYVSYTYKTVAIDNYIWKNKTIAEELNVSKAALGAEDLGRYVAKELGEEVDAKFSYLKNVQDIEKNRGVTRKVVTITYSGLVGRFLDSKEEVFEGYVAVVPEQRPVIASVEEGKVSAQIAASNELSAQVAAAVPSRAEIQKIIEQTVRELLAKGNNIVVSEVAVQATSTASATDTQAGDTESPVITILGNNPAEIVVGTSYADLGATVTDNVNDNLGIRYKVNGIEVANITIDTSADGTHTITYSATDQTGNTGTAERTVIVGTGIAPAAESTGTPPTDTASTTSSGTDSATTTAEAPPQDDTVVETPAPVDTDATATPETSPQDDTTVENAPTPTDTDTATTPESTATSTSAQ